VSNPTIAKALIGSPTEFSAQILALKTQREREVIESEMAVNSNLTSEEIESNRVQLMSVIKEQIKR
jgi:flagellar motor switch protein FliG